MNDDFLHRLRRDPRPEFAQQLLARLDTDVMTQPRSHLAPPHLRGQRSWLGIAVAAVLLLSIGMGVSQWVGRPQPVSAREILTKVELVGINGTSVRSVHLKSMSEYRFPLDYIRGTPVPGGVTGGSTNLTELWEDAPNRWRIDLRQRSGSLPPALDTRIGSASDGDTEWSYSPLGLDTEIQIGALPTGATPPKLNTIQLPTGNQQRGEVVTDTLLTRCHPQPTISGEATVAGRATYVINLGPDTCATYTRASVNGTEIPGPTTSPDVQGRQTMWVDKETYLILKQELLYPDGSSVSRYEVTEIAYNVVIPTDVLALPPTDLTIVRTTDLRPQPYRVPDSAILPGGRQLPALVYPPSSPTSTP